MFCRKRLTENEPMVAQRKDRGKDRQFGKHVYTLLYLRWINGKDLLYSTWCICAC